MPNKVKVTIGDDATSSISVNGNNIDKIKWWEMKEIGGEKFVKICFIADELEISDNGLFYIDSMHMKPEEESLIAFWRKSPEMHGAIKKLLGMGK